LPAELKRMENLNLILLAKLNYPEGKEVFDFYTRLKTEKVNMFKNL